MVEDVLGERDAGALLGAHPWPLPLAAGVTCTDGQDHASATWSNQHTATGLRNAIAVGGGAPSDSGGKAGPSNIAFWPCSFLGGGVPVLP